MNIAFDKYGKHEIPTFTLCNPDKREISSINIRNTKTTLRFNNISEIDFEAPDRYTNDENKTFIYSYYNDINVHKLILVDGFGYFIIQNVRERSDGVERYKSINAKSFQYELANKSVFKFSGTYQFYNPESEYDKSGETLTFMGYVMSKLQGWVIESVDEELFDIYRTFDESDCTLLELLYDRAEEAYQCIFEFNYLIQSINVYSIAHLSNYPNNTDIFLSFDNLLRNLEINEDATDIRTKIYVDNDNLDIRQVNPAGTDYIVNLDYYLNEKWMTQDIILAIKAWNKKIEDNKSAYADKLTELYDEKIILQQLTSQKTTLQGELTQFENVLSVQIEGGVATSGTSASIAAKKNEINAVQNNIDNENEIINAISEELLAINNVCKYENNFTDNQIKIIDRYLIEGTYTNDDYVVTDIMNPSDIQKMAQELYDEAILAAKKLAQPSFSFSVTANNFMFIPDFSEFARQIDIGKTINIENYGEIVYQPILLELTFSWDNPDSFELFFGNRFTITETVYQYSDLVAKAVTMSKKVSKLSKASSPQNFSSQSQQGDIDITNRIIKSSNNLNQTWDSSGLTFRKSTNAITAGTPTYEPRQLKIINNSIMATSNDWQSTQPLVKYVSGINKYGIVGESVVGKMNISDNNLTVEGAFSGGKFTLASDGMTIYKGTGNSASKTFYADNDGIHISSGIISSDVNISASSITSGTLATERIPNLSASKITSGTFSNSLIPNLSASKITSGTFGTAQIPNLSATKITSGTFGTAQIPNLSATKITSGTFGIAQIPMSSVASSLSEYNVYVKNLYAETALSTIGITGTPFLSIYGQNCYANQLSPLSSSLGLVLGTSYAKLGFFGGSGYNKGTVSNMSVSSSTTVSDVGNKLNTLLTLLRNYGLIY